MIDAEFENKVKEIVFKTLKEAGICPNLSVQTTLTPNDVELEEEMSDYMEDKQVLVWLGKTERGKKQGVKCNQVYIATRGSMKVEMVLPFTFDEMFSIWEAYFKGNSLEDIFFTVIFDEDDVGLSYIRLAVWALLHGKCNYMLNFVNEDRYEFDFKKYSGRF